MFAMIIAYLISGVLALLGLIGVVASVAGQKANVKAFWGSLVCLCMAWFVAWVGGV
jgi:hypothetical protein|uniref:Uncharacterized protein n=1 Tax=viral metagenome TaxID=1070528 RepID=A0A6H1ZB84_9ZZZZ